MDRHTVGNGWPPAGISASVEDTIKHKTANPTGFVTANSKPNIGWVALG